MKRKKMRLSLGKLTVADLDAKTQDNVLGGATCSCITVLSRCCTINVATCIHDEDTVCNPADTYGGPGTICP
jgi:hypothetical protein